jgi:hypothetical protein
MPNDWILLQLNITVTLVILAVTALLFGFRRGRPVYLLAYDVFKPPDRCFVGLIGLPLNVAALDKHWGRLSTCFECCLYA